MVKRSKDLQVFDFLRFPLMLLVVAIHVVPYLGGELSIHSEDNIILSIVKCFTSTVLICYIMPVYYFISGYLFFFDTEFSFENYMQKLRRRVKTLLIPYIIWNGLAIMSSLIVNIATIIKYPSLVNINPHSLLTAFWVYKDSFYTTIDCSDNTMPINLPLWYVRNLMIAVICAPLIFEFIKRWKYYFIILVGGLWFAEVFWETFDRLSFTMTFLFFSAGAYMSINQKNLTEVFVRSFRYSMILYPCLVIIHTLSLYACRELSPIINKLCILAGMLFVYNFAYWLLDKGYCRINSFLLSSSFFIYVSHMIIIEQINFAYYLVRRFVAPQLNIAVPKWIWMYILVITSSLLIYYLMRRFTPSLLNLLTGKRSGSL